MRNNDYIRSLLIMFNNKSEYEIETALLIYELFEKDIKEISNKEINEVYDIVHSQDDLFDDYIKEKIIEVEKNNNKELENDMDEIEK